MQKNVASQKIQLFAFDTTTNLPKTGDAANITAYVSKDHGAVTVLGDLSATEMEATNAKGIYVFDLTQAETNADELTFTAKSATANISITPRFVTTVPAKFATMVIDAAGLVDANAVKLGPTGAGTAQTARDIGASVLLSTGTGTGQLDFTSGVVKSNLAQILGTALTETAGQIAAAFKKFFNIATPASTMDALTLVATATNLTNAPTAGDFTATMKTSIGTAVAASAVASVTGNVGGNVVGSVGSVGSGAITTSSFAAGAINAAAIGADAITDAKVAADVTIASVTGAVGSVTGAVGSVTGNVGGNVVGSVASVSGNVGGNVTGSVGSVATGGITTGSFAAGAINAAAIGADAITAAKVADGTIDAATFAAGAINAAAIAADAITDAKVAADVTIASVTGAVGSVTGAVGSVTGAVGSVTGNVGGNVVGSVASVTAGVTVTTNNDKTGYALTVGERTAIANEVENQIIDETDSEKVLTAITDKIASVNPSLGSLTLAAIAASVWDLARSGHATAGTFGEFIDAAISSRSTYAGADTSGTTTLLSRLTSTRAGLLDNLDAAVSTRLATAGYTAPLSAAGTRTAIGLASANLDTQLDALPTAAENADAVLDEAIAGHLTAGTVGAAIDAAGSAGDPWATALPGAYGAGTAGKIVGDNLDATVSSRLPTSSYAAPLSAAGTRAAVGLASANLDTQFDTLPTAAENASAVRIELATELGRVDAAVSSRLPTSSYVAPLTAATTRAAIGLASADLDNQLSALPTAPEAATAVRTELATELARMDATISSRLASGAYTAPDNAAVTAIKAKTDTIPASPAAVGSAMTLASDYDFAKGTVAMVEAYAAEGDTITPAQALHMIWALLSNRGIVATTLTAKKIDGSTTAMTFALDDASAPTSQVRAT